MTVPFPGPIPEGHLSTAGETAATSSPDRDSFPVHDIRQSRDAAIVCRMLDAAHFASCYLQLLARLWEEFDLLAGDIEQTPAAPEGGTSQTILRIQALRLELLLLRERCERFPLRARLGPARLLRLQALLDDLSGCLDSVTAAGASACQRQAAWRAQDRLFDEAQWAAPTTLHPGETAVGLRTGHGQ